LNVFQYILLSDVLFIHRCGKDEYDLHIAACIGEADTDTAW